MTMISPEVEDRARQNRGIRNHGILSMVVRALKPGQHPAQLTGLTGLLRRFLRGFCENVLVVGQRIPAPESLLFGRLAWSALDLSKQMQIFAGAGGNAGRMGDR